MMETGESAAAMSQRVDDENWPRILSALKEGGVLKIHTKVRRAAVEGISHEDSRYHLTMSPSRVKRLATEGVLNEVAMDTYALAEFSLKMQ